MSAATSDAHRPEYVALARSEQRLRDAQARLARLREALASARAQWRSDELSNTLRALRGQCFAACCESVEQALEAVIHAECVVTLATQAHRNARARWRSAAPRLTA
jgi:hypothetical protein